MIRRSGAKALVMLVALVTAGTLVGATAIGAAAKPTGDPIKIGVIYTEGVAGTDNPTLLGGAEAAAGYLGTKDGIGGRPVEIVGCNDKADPAEDVACANKFVDEGVVAVTGLGPTWGDNGLPIIERAGIPFVGLPISNAEFLNPASYPIAGGSAAAFPALAKYFIDKKVKKVVVIYADLAAGKLAADALLGDRFKAVGINDVTLIPEKIGAPDFTPAVVKANEGDPDVIFTLFQESDCARIFEAAAQLGVTAAIGAPGSCAEGDAFEDIDPEVVGRAVFNTDTVFFKKKDKDAKIYRSSLKKFAKGTPVDSFGATTFSGVMTLKDIIEGLGADSITGQAILDTLANADGIPVFMATELNKANAAELAGVAIHVYDADQRIVKLKNGKFVDAGGNRWWNGFVD
jgi:ABC-type branched-subunit amino acid transport system substrate-binding protein